MALATAALIWGVRAARIWAIRSLWLPLLEVEVMAEDVLDPELEPNLELDEVEVLATATAPLASSRPARGPSQAGEAL